MNDKELLNQNTLGFIGIAKKSGNLICGEDQSLKAVEENKVRLLLVAADASANTRKKVGRAVDIFSVRCIYVPYTAEQLGGIIGFARCTVCAVLDTKIASELADRFAEMSDDDRDRLMAAKLKLARYRQIERQLRNKESEMDIKNESRRKNANSKSNDRRREKKTNENMNQLINELGNGKQIKKEKFSCESGAETKGVQKERGSR